METSRLAVSRRPESRRFRFRLTRPRSWRLILLVSTDFRPKITFYCLSDQPIRRFTIPPSVDSEIEKIRAIAEFAESGFASLKRYIHFEKSSDAHLPRMVAEIDVIAWLIKRLVPSLATFLKRSIPCTSLNDGTEEPLLLCEWKNGRIEMSGSRSFKYSPTKISKQLWALQFSLWVIQFDNVSSKPGNFHISKVWTLWLPCEQLPCRKEL